MLEPKTLYYVNREDLFTSRTGITRPNDPSGRREEERSGALQRRSLLNGSTSRPTREEPAQALESSRGIAELPNITARFITEPKASSCEVDIELATAPDEVKVVKRCMRSSKGDQTSFWSHQI